MTNKLESDGWVVLRFWGNEIKKNVGQCVDEIERIYKER